MKKSLLLLAALACSGAVAQEKEIWACQQVEGTMLFWENSSWTQLLINPKPLLLTIDGKNSSYKMGDFETGLDCSLAGAFTSCITGIPAGHIFMDTATGRMGISNLYGAILSSSENRDSVFAQIYNCTKF
jgi:hypothetical protein